MQGVLDRQPAPKRWDQPKPLGSGTSETLPGGVGQTGKTKAQSDPFSQDRYRALVPVPCSPSVCAGRVWKLTLN